MLEKARGLSCDVVVLDLEDSVAPEAKDAAREAVCAAVRSYGAREVVVRINPLASSHGKADLEAVRAAAPDAILLPKVESPADIVAVTGSLPIWAMIETPLGVLNAAAIAASGAACLTMGTNDLLKAMHAQPLPDRRNLWLALSATVLAARAHGASVIDGTYNDIADEAGFAESCIQGRAFGFDGKTLIHPKHLEICNRVFSPSADEIAWSQAVIAAFKAPENAGKGALRVDGKMAERLHLSQAEHLVAVAAAIAAKAG